MSDEAVIAIRQRVEEAKSLHERRRTALNKWAKMPTRESEDELDRLSDECVIRLEPLIEDVQNLLTENGHAVEWLNATVAMCGREINYLRQYDVTRDEIHHAHQTFVGLMYQALFALTGEKDFEKLHQRVKEEIEKAANPVGS